MPTAKSAVQWLESNDASETKIPGQKANNFREHDWLHPFLLTEKTRAGIFANTVSTRPW